jgi:hypothetical protein
VLVGGEIGTMLIADSVGELVSLAGAIRTTSV